MAAAHNAKDLALPPAASDTRDASKGNCEWQQRPDSATMASTAS